MINTSLQAQAKKKRTGVIFRKKEMEERAKKVEIVP
jgi:hypothetical protein